MSNYPIPNNVEFPIACCAILNFIRMNSTRDTEEYEALDLEVHDEESIVKTQEFLDINLSQSYLSRINGVRDDIVVSMWLNYCVMQEKYEFM